MACDAAETASYDVEFKWKGDDAWYSVSVVLDSETETLTVRYLTFPPVYDSTFTAGEFKTAAEVDDFVGRFRPISQQLQDPQCFEVVQGVKVCAVHKTSHGDVRFYDAVVEAVHHQEHSFANGEEECSCTFVICWLHGPDSGNLTSASIEDICILRSAGQVDPRIAAFSKLAKEKIRIASLKSTFDSEHGTSASNGPSSHKENCLSLQKKSESSQSRSQDAESGMEFSGLKSTSGGKISKDNQQREEDRDIGGESSELLGSIGADNYYFILIGNLEKDLSQSSIKQFIHQQTDVLAQAFVFPRRNMEPVARGAVVVDCRKKLEKIYEFLNNPNHLIVSRRGRPWVIIEKGLRREMFGMPLWSMVPLCQDTCHNKIVDTSVVHIGSEAYRRAKLLRDLFLAFVAHEQGLYQRLSLEEQKILQS